MKFSDFGLDQPLLRAVGDEGYSEPTPIQEQAIPHVLSGRDLLGCAQTGTGKTAAFALPILQRLAAQPTIPGRRRPRCLVLAPTRELAAQIDASFRAYGQYTGLRSAVVFGGVNMQRQVRAMQRGVDMLIATPGRLLDLLGQHAVSLSEVQVYVLDECDRMLDLGFIQDVKRITALLPKRRQTLLFSATMPQSIRSLAESLLVDPVQVAVTPVATPAARVEQSVYFVEKSDKRRLLTGILRGDPAIDRALVFTRTKHTANRVAEHLAKSGIRADAIHGNKSQGARERALSLFKQGGLRALVATDIAARGIDIDRLACVINYDLPNEPEAYVHRIGRTGRAGSSGRALSFCERDERSQLRGIERLTRADIRVVEGHPFAIALAAASQAGAAGSGASSRTATSAQRKPGQSAVPPAPARRRRRRRRSGYDRASSPPA